MEYQLYNVLWSCHTAIIDLLFSLIVKSEESENGKMAQLFSRTKGLFLLWTAYILIFLHSVFMTHYCNKNSLRAGCLHHLQKHQSHRTSKLRKRSWNLMSWQHFDAQTRQPISAKVHNLQDFSFNWEEMTDIWSRYSVNLRPQNLSKE